MHPSQAVHRRVRLMSFALLVTGLIIWPVTQRGGAAS
jgi:hypothetical protein